MLPSPSPSVRPPQTAKITRGHSCVLCRRRKIKCDGQRPCQNCQRSRAVCVAVEIAPSKRKKRKQEDLADRLRRAEEALSKAGLKVEDDDDEYVDVGEGSESGGTVLMEMGPGNGRVAGESNRTIEDGKLIVDQGQSRYIEPCVWGSLSAEVREDSIHLLQHSEDETTNDICPVSDYSSILFGRLMVCNSLLSIHPTPVQIFRLWQVFLNNINPLTKILHAPTVQELLLQAMGDVDTVSPSTEALMFALYHAAIVSLDEHGCQSILGESRVSALAKYSTATQQALINAKLLRTSNLVVLQAFTLYLISIREFTDHDTLWVLSGIATKIGRRIGLHRDSPSTPLSVLEAEIRRRLWWQILAIEGQSSFYSGSADFVHRPSRILNLNDSDLSPAMREPPAEQAAITEMLFCSIIYEIGNFMYDNLMEGGKAISPAADGAEQRMSMFKAIDELEIRLEQKYIRYCDLSVPLHYLASVAFRAALSKVRLRFYTAPRSPNGPPQPLSERDAAFTIALNCLQIDNERHSVDGQAKLKGFRWHTQLFFPLEAFVYTLSELRLRTTGAQVYRAWRLIEGSYLRHVEVSRKTKPKLWLALGNLCLKAWEERVKGSRSQQGAAPLTIPACVGELYAERGVKGGLFGASESQELTTIVFANTADLPLQNTQILGSQLDDMLSTYVPFDNADMGAMDWQYWQTLFDDSGVPLT